MKLISRFPLLFLSLVIALVALTVLMGVLPGPETGGLALAGAGVLSVQRNTLGDLLIQEVEHLTREDGVYHGSDIVFGQVLAEVGGKYVAYNTAGADGSEVAVAVAAKDYAAAAGDLNGYAIRRLGVVNAELLVWPAGITAPQKAAALASLRAQHILTKTLL